MTRTSSAFVFAVAFAWVGFSSISSSAQDLLGDFAAALTNSQGRWARTDYIVWWFDGSEVPALVTTSPTGTAQAQAGILGNPTTRLIAGGKEVGEGERQGGRLTIGQWLNSDQTHAIEFEYSGVGPDPDGRRFSATSSGDPYLMRPFFNVNTGQEDAELVAFNDANPVVAGSINVDRSSEMHSFAITIKRELAPFDNLTLQQIGGYRYFRFREGLQITENLTSTDTTATLIPTGTTLSVFDRFAVENDFHGGEFGIAGQSQFGALWIETQMKVAVGAVRKRSRVRGGTTVTTPPPGSTTASSDGGLLALPSNQGTARDNQWAFLPELTVQGRLDLTDRISAHAGYSVIFLDNLFRVGEQIDRNIDPTQITNLGQTGAAAGQTRPASQPTDSQFWAQGIHVGLTIWFP